MLAFAIRRVVLAIAAFFILSYAVWLLTTREGIYALHHLAFETLVPARYQQWLGGILRGDLGYSIRAQQPVIDALRDRAKVTLLLIIPAFLLQEGVAIGIGVYSGARYRSAIDRLFSVIAFIGVAAPPFWLALIAVEFLAVQWHLLPPSGLISYRLAETNFDSPQYWVFFHANTGTAIADIAQHLILPVTVLAFTGVAADSQFVRLTLVEVLNQDYIRSARARGLPQRTVLWKHALRNTLIPLLTNIGLQLPRLVFAASLIELIFSLHGVGGLFATAIYTPPAQTPGGAVRLPKDYAVVTAYFLVLGIVSLLSSMLTDFLYASADPRIRTNATAQPFIGNPYTSRRPLVRFGRVGVTVGHLMVATTVMLVGILGVRTFQAYHVEPPPPIDGTWVGSVTYAGLQAQTVLLLRLRVDGKGGIAGDGNLCQYLPQEDTSVVVPVNLTGQTDRESVFLNWTTSTGDQYVNFTGEYPIHTTKLALAGTYVVFGNARNATTTLARGTQGDYDRQCAAVLPPATPSPTP